MASSIKFPPTILVSLSILAKMIDHSLLHPTMSDTEIATGLSIAAKYKVATACVKPYSIEQAISALKGTGVDVCPVIGFPAGNSTTEVKVFEATKAAEAGGKEIDMTSTGYGFVKQSNGMYNYQGATLPHLNLMRENVKEGVQIKAAGGVRTLDDLLRVRALGVTRVGATATEAILEEALRRGIGQELVEVNVLPLSSV
ncbi:hypothetical protein BOTCAL_0213g00130 [Botryotinia calthae]|uniref:Deoxyribose-phosphate aldolase n=1 Tax=Botryotinia calthae TaxID=38488 RepID=A0A4Y8D0T1_9HELO|nr:hypothetical protein BOTCAL_0213g00130 [Botryotinia calthae]